MEFSWRRLGMPVIATSVVAIVALGILVLVVRDNDGDTGSANDVVTSSTPGVPLSPCLNQAQFEQVAAELGHLVFEGSKVTVTAIAPVICEDGWVFANTTITHDSNGSTRESYILLHHKDTWEWAGDTYRYGDTRQECPKLPTKIRAALRCP